MHRSFLKWKAFRRKSYETWADDLYRDGELYLFIAGK